MGDAQVGLSVCVPAGQAEGLGLTVQELKADWNQPETFRELPSVPVAEIVMSSASTSPRAKPHVPAGAAVANVTVTTVFEAPSGSDV